MALRVALNRGEMSVDDDNYFETKSFNKRSNWVMAIVIILTLGVLALPFVWAFTGAF